MLQKLDVIAGDSNFIPYISTGYSIGVFSSHYTFSLHDETSFDTSLLLSSGEQHAEMLRTDLCLQGTATYDANILTVRRR